MRKQRILFLAGLFALSVAAQDPAIIRVHYSLSNKSAKAGQIMIAKETTRIARKIRYVKDIKFDGAVRIAEKPVIDRKFHTEVQQLELPAQQALDLAVDQNSCSIAQAALKAGAAVETKHLKESLSLLMSALNKHSYKQLAYKLWCTVCLGIPTGIVLGAQVHDATARMLNTKESPATISAAYATLCAAIGLSWYGIKSLHNAYSGIEKPRLFLLLLESSELTAQTRASLLSQLDTMVAQHHNKTGSFGILRLVRAHIVCAAPRSTDR